MDISKKQITTLVALQKIDIESAKLEVLLQDVPIRISALDKRLEALDRDVKNDEEIIHELNKKYRDCESDVQVNLGKIKKSEEKLRSVKTNKEYQMSLKEIEDLKAINYKIEDKMLEFLEKIEGAETHLNARQENYSEIVDETDREKEIINQNAGQNKKRLLELESDRIATSAELDDRLLNIFNRQRMKQSDGVAIAEVKDGVCQGCYMNIPAQMYNELQRGNSLINCPSCERLIYWEKQDERSE